MVEVLRIITIYGSDSKIIICDQHLTGQERGFKRLTGVLKWKRFGRGGCPKTEEV